VRGDVAEDYPEAVAGAILFGLGVPPTEARKRARTMVGGNCSDEMADRHMRKEWRNRTDGKEIIRRAMKPRDPPPPLEPVDWSTAIDPAAPHADDTFDGVA